MNLLSKSSIALAVAAAASISGAAHAQNLAVTAKTTGTYVFTYSVTPTFDTTSLVFSFKDPTVSYVSETGPLTADDNFSPGNFLQFGFNGATLTGGSTETVTFDSTTAPNSVNISSNGPGGTGQADNVVAPVPEASTTVSFGLLLMLGLGGLVVAARKKSAQSAA